MRDPLHPSPIYTPENTNAAFQLNWSLSLFPEQFVPPPSNWIHALREVTESSGVRVLESQQNTTGTLQFLISTRPDVSPSTIVREIKGRLQYLIRATSPRAFRRNYRIDSVGRVKAEVIEQYVRGQVEHHLAQDPATAHRLVDLQIETECNLSQVRTSAHGQFIYNLHLVLCRMSESRLGRIDDVDRIRRRIHQVCDARSFLLSCAGILPDHLHAHFGCPLEMSPLDTALCFLNNLAYAEGMSPVYRFGFYVGTCGAYDLDAIRRQLNPTRGGENPG
jgi:REP element-mobilizing transposase RayT